MKWNAVTFTPSRINRWIAVLCKQKTIKSKPESSFDFGQSLVMMRSSDDESAHEGWRHLIRIQNNESYYCEAFLLNIHEPSLLHWWITRLNLYYLINIYKPGVRNRMAINERHHDLINIDQLSLRHSRISQMYCFVSCAFGAANWCTRGITVHFNVRTATLLGFHKQIK